jgi:hypothetical protein
MAPPHSIDLSLLQRPPEYGGTGTPLRESPDHKALVAAAEKWKELEAKSQPPPTQNGTTPSLTKTVITPQTQSATSGKWNWFGSSKEKAASTEAFLGETNK